MSIIIITGGSRGIGASAALECARRGLGVILTYNRNPQAAEAVVRHIGMEGGKAVALPLDLGDVGTFAALLLTGDGSWVNAQSIEVAGGYII